MRTDCLTGSGHLLGWWKCSRTRQWWWLHHMATVTMPLNCNSNAVKTVNFMWCEFYHNTYIHTYIRVIVGPNLSDPCIPTCHLEGKGREGRCWWQERWPPRMAPVMCSAARVLGLNATSNTLDPVDPPLAARGSPGLAPDPSSRLTSHQTQSGSRGTSWSPCCTWLTSGTSKHPQKNNMSLCTHERLQRSKQFSCLLGNTPPNNHPELSASYGVNAHMSDLTYSLWKSCLSGMRKAGHRGVKWFFPVVTQLGTDAGWLPHSNAHTQEPTPRHLPKWWQQEKTWAALKPEWGRGEACWEGF